MEIGKLHERITQLQKENDNLLLSLRLQGEKERQLKGDSNGDSAMTDFAVDSGNVDDLVNELIRTKKENAEMRLNLEVLAEKVIRSANPESKQVLKEADSVFEMQFPPLNGHVVEKKGGMGRNWAMVAAPNRDRAAGADLHFVSPTDMNGTKVVQITDEEVADGIDRWKKAIIVYVLGAKPPFHVMKQFVERKWSQFGEIKIYLLKTGVFVMEFRDVGTIVDVMEAGSWTFDNKPVIIRPWSVDANLEREELGAVPIWVRFPNLKLHLWSTSVLSKIASTIGKPLFTDKMTAEKERITFARVCVEVKVGEALPDCVVLMDEKGGEIIQKVEYEWVPISCKGCGVFGHTEARCQRKKAVPKQQRRVKEIKNVVDDASKIELSKGEKREELVEQRNGVAMGDCVVSEAEAEMSNAKVSEDPRSVNSFAVLASEDDEMAEERVEVLNADHVTNEDRFKYRQSQQNQMSNQKKKKNSPIRGLGEDRQ